MPELRTRFIVEAGDGKKFFVMGMVGDKLMHLKEEIERVYKKLYSGQSNYHELHVNQFKKGGAFLNPNDIIDMILKKDDVISVTRYGQDEFERIKANRTPKRNGPAGAKKASNVVASGASASASGAASEKGNKTTPAPKQPAHQPAQSSAAPAAAPASKKSVGGNKK